MIKRGVILVLLVSSSLAFAQLDSNTVTVTSSQTSNLQPDQVVFAVTVNSGLSASLDDIVAALQGSGITIGNFSSVSTSFPANVQSSAMLQWSFVLAVPLAKMKDAITSLAGLQQAISGKRNGLSLSFNVQGVQVSTQLQQSQTCSISDLLSNARTQAQKLTDAAGLTLGVILGMSSGTSTSAGNAIPSFSSPQSWATTPPNCTVAVKFAVLR